MDTRLNSLSLRSLSVLGAVALGLMPASRAVAADIYWDFSAAPNGTTGIYTWGTATNWSTLSGATTPDPAATPGSSDVAIFSPSSALPFSFGANRTVSGVLINGTGNVTLYSHPSANTSFLLTLGSSGLTVASGAGTVTTVGNSTNGFLSYRINANQSWTNDSSNLLTISGGISNPTTTTAYTLTLAGAGSGGITLSSAITNNATNSAGSLALAVNASGAGSMNLNGANTFSGGTTLTAGTVKIGVASVGSVGAITSGAFGTGSLTINGGTIMSNGATARTILNAATFGGDATLSDSTNTGTITFSAATSLGGGTRQLTVASSGFAQFDGVISNGGITKAGGGFLTLTGANTYAGGTTISAGTVRLGASSAGAVGAITSGPLGTGSLALNGGTLMSNNTSSRTLYNDVSIGGDITLSNGTNTGAVIFSGAADLGGATRQISVATSGFATFDGVISNGALTKADGGTLTLAGANTFAGNLTLTTGALRVGSSSVGTVGSITSGSLGTGTVYLNGGSVLSNSTSARTFLNPLVFGGDVSLGSTNTSFNGALTFSGAADLGGAVRQLTTNSGVQFDGVLSNGGLTKAGTGNLTLTATNTYSGATTISAGNLVVGNGTDAGSIASTSGITNNAGLIYNVGSGDRTLNAGITGTGNLTKNGSGTLTLAGTSSYSGATSIVGGGLKLNGSLTNTSVTMESGTTLSGNGTFGSGTTVTINGTHTPGNSPGLQTFNNLTYNTGSAVTWELAANKSTLTGVAGTDFDQIVTTGTLNFAGSTALNLSFNGAGSAVNWGDSFWSSNQSWVVFSNTNAVSNLVNLSLNTSDWTDSNGTLFSTALAGASFSLGLGGNNVVLSYTAAAIPEPSTYAALAGLAALGTAVWRRRRAAAAAAAAKVE